MFKALKGSLNGDLGGVSGSGVEQRLPTVVGVRGRVTCHAPFVRHLCRDPWWTLVGKSRGLLSLLVTIGVVNMSDVFSKERPYVVWPLTQWPKES